MQFRIAILSPLHSLATLGNMTRIEIMGLYHPLDGVTNLKYKLLYFLTPNKKNFIEKGAGF